MEPNIHWQTPAQHVQQRAVEKQNENSQQNELQEFLPPHRMVKPPRVNILNIYSLLTLFLSWYGPKSIPEVRMPLFDPYVTSYIRNLLYLIQFSPSIKSVYNQCKIFLKNTQKHPKQFPLSKQKLIWSVFFIQVLVQDRRPLKS